MADQKSHTPKLQPRLFSRMVTPADLEREVRAETAAQQRMLLRRQGSWFKIPNMHHASWGNTPLQRKRLVDLGQIFSTALVTGPWVIPTKDSVQPRYAKQDHFLEACVVVCMHCRSELHFKLIDARWQASPACRECLRPLWPNGGWIEANVVRRMLGDFAAFNAMLINPPST